jgi:hypothetical protein
VTAAVVLVVLASGTAAAVVGNATARSPFIGTMDLARILPLFFVDFGWVVSAGGFAIAFALAFGLVWVLMRLVKRGPEAASIRRRVALAAGVLVGTVVASALFVILVQGVAGGF